MPTSRRAMYLIALVAMFSIVGGVAYALVATAGGSMVQRQVRTETAASVSSSTAYVAVAGTPVTITVPSGSSRLITARYTAESQCNGGGAGNWCSIRLLARNQASGAFVYLDPQSHLDAAFDAVGASEDYWEGNSIARARRLPSGTWTIFAQRAVTSASTSFRLDDWTFEVDVNI